MDIRILLYFLTFASAFLAVQACIGASRQITVGIKHANARLREKDKSETNQDLLTKMRRDRGMTSDGVLQSLNFTIGKLVIQSGLPLGEKGIYAAMAGSAIILPSLIWIWKHSMVWAAPAIFLGALIPFIVLKWTVKRRRKKAVEQLPEALDVIVRSLKAGHPISVAMGLVGREMPDPIGSEFGIASDEISFGSQVSHAIGRLSERVGQEDFDLFAAMIRLQEKTGGNLAELLASSSKTIRDRQRMRLKIRAASSEGRASAMILNAAPIALFLLIKLTTPEFYGDVADSSIVTYGLYAVAGWMFIGNLVMRKMINFNI